MRRHRAMKATVLPVISCRMQTRKMPKSSLSPEEIVAALSETKEEKWRRAPPKWGPVVFAHSMLDG